MRAGNPLSGAKSPAQQLLKGPWCEHGAGIVRFGPSKMSETSVYGLPIGTTPVCDEERGCKCG